MDSEVTKVEIEMESCCVCGAAGDDLHSPEEHDAGAPPAQPPLRAMLLHLNHTKMVPSGRLCPSCIHSTVEAYTFSTMLAARGPPPLSEKIRALRKRLHELTQKIDVFIVVGGGADGAYSEEDIIMVEREALAAAAAADAAELARARSLRGDRVYQCTVCPRAFQRGSVAGGRPVPRARGVARRGRAALVLDVRRTVRVARRRGRARRLTRGARPAALPPLQPDLPERGGAPAARGGVSVRVPGAGLRRHVPVARGAARARGRRTRGRRTRGGRVRRVPAHVPVGGRAARARRAAPAGAPVRVRLRRLHPAVHGEERPAESYPQVPRRGERGPPRGGVPPAPAPVGRAVRAVPPLRAHVRVGGGPAAARARAPRRARGGAGGVVRGGARGVPGGGGAGGGGGHRGLLADNRTLFHCFGWSGHRCRFNLKCKKKLVILMEHLVCSLI